MVVNRVAGTSNQLREKFSNVIEPESFVSLQAHAVKLSLWHEATRTWADAFITDRSK